MDNDFERILIAIVWNNKRHHPVSILGKASCLTVLKRISIPLGKGFNFGANIHVCGWYVPYAKRKCVMFHSCIRTAAHVTTLW